MRLVSNQSFHCIIICLFFICISEIVATGTKGKNDGSYNKRTGEKFLEDVKKRPGIIKLKTDLLIEIFKESTKQHPLSPNERDLCDISYNATLRDGTMIETGREDFIPSKCVSAWWEVLQYMVEGDHWRIYSPYFMAYKAEGKPPLIPPYSAVIFDIELHKVKRGGKVKAEAREMFKFNQGEYEFLPTDGL